AAFVHARPCMVATGITVHQRAFSANPPQLGPWKGNSATMSKDALRPPAAAGEPSLSGELRGQSDRIWAGLHAHPFLRELGRGVLPLEKFRFFLEQDIMYLPDFARCIATGAAKSATEAELGFFAQQL